MPDVLLINPNNRVVSEFSAIEPPLWAGVIASYFEKLGRSVRILDAEALDFTVDETVEAVKDFNPATVMIVVMGNNPSVSSTPKMVVTKELVERLKRDYHVSVTGLHPTALMRETEKELGVYVVPGKFFDGLPPVAWDLLPMKTYRAHVWHCLDGSPRTPYASIYTTMNCPYSCAFCNIHALYDGIHEIMYRKPDDIIKEIDLLATKYMVKNIKFWDELFTFNKEHVNEICDLLTERDYGLNIWAYARVDSVEPKMLVKMKKAGINWLSYGFEAGDDDVLKSAHKRATKDRARLAVKMTHEAGINVMGNFIVGLPNETKAQMQQTMDFAKSLNIEFMNLYQFYAYPGSPLYKRMQGNWQTFDQYGKGDGEISEFRDRAFMDYFTHIDYLNNVKKKFGVKAVCEILRMVKAGKPQSRGSYADLQTIPK